MFIGQGNKSILENIIIAETKKFSKKKLDFFKIKDNKVNPEIPKEELFLMFDFILEIQAIFRRYYCPVMKVKEKDSIIDEKYTKGLRNLVSHSHLFFDKGGRRYVDVASEKIKLALEFFDSYYKEEISSFLKEKQQKRQQLEEELENRKNNNNWKDTTLKYQKEKEEINNQMKNFKRKSEIVIQKEIIKEGDKNTGDIREKTIIINEGKLKSDFIRSLKALCSRKDYFYIEVLTPKEGGKEGFNKQQVEVKFSKEEVPSEYSKGDFSREKNNTLKNNQHKFSSKDMVKGIKETIKHRKEYLEKSKFEEKKRIYLNLLRQKMKNKIIAIKEENQSKNQKRVNKVIRRKEKDNNSRAGENKK